LRGLVWAELLGLRRSRAALVLMGVTAFFVALSTFGNAATEQHKITLGQVTPADASYFLVGVASVSFLFAAIGGALRVTGELRSRSMGLTVLACPDRTPVLVAKSLVAAALGGAYGLVAVATAAGIGFVELGPQFVLSSRIVGLGALVVAAGALAGPWGVMIGTLLRSSLLAGGALFIYTAMAEAAVIHYFPVVGRWLPGGALASLLTDPSVQHRLAPVAGLAVLVGWLAVAAAAAVPAFRRQEL